MARVRVQLNRAGVREVLRSEGVQAELRRRADRVVQAAASGPRPHTGEVDYTVDVSAGRQRARAAVIARHPGALGLEARYRTLGRAVDAARI